MLAQDVGLVTDLVRLFLGTVLLAFASYTDWMWRRAPNVLWLILAGAGVVLLAVEAVLTWDTVRAQWAYLAFVPAFWVAILVFYRYGLIAGGADAKALLALGILAPFPLDLGAGLPLLQSPLPGSFVIMANSLLAFLLIPVTLFLLNLVRGDFAIPAAFLGTRVPVEGFEDRHAWPMQVLEEGVLRMRYFASRNAGPLEEELEALRAAGVKTLWATPKVPYMIPLLVGFILAFTAGDVLLGLLQAVLPRAG